MGVSLSIIQPQVSIVIDGEDPQVLAAIDADTLNGVTAGTTGLLLLATATAGAARTVLGVDSDDAVTFGALTAPSVQATASGGLLLKNSSGTTVATIGAGPGTGTTLAGALALSGSITGATTIAASAGITSATNVIGTDPGGSELLRVGGAIRAGTVVINGNDQFTEIQEAGVTKAYTQWINASNRVDHYSVGSHRFIGGVIVLSKITTVSAVPGSFASLADVQTWLAAQFT
jgi:hypothetical protein